jgi:hypothetical protein
VKAKLSLSERIFACEACGQVQDRDLNAALNLARMAQLKAESEGFSSYMARSDGSRELRGGQVSLVHLDEHSPMKREGSSESSQRRKALALA